MRGLAKDIAEQQRKLRGFRFLPLVTESLHVGCKLNIFFLSKALHQRIFEGHDLDNRLKGLFDGLRRPNEEQEIPADWSFSADEDPLFCLLEDDCLITEFQIAGDTLLAPKDTDPDLYQLIIRVNIWPIQLISANSDFL